MTCVVSNTQTSVALQRYGAETDFVEIVKLCAFIIVVHLYETGIDFFDQTWKSDDVVKVD